ncbi:unnamed protein product, partial [Ixodes persulcatus]
MADSSTLGGRSGSSTVKPGPLRSAVADGFFVCSAAPTLAGASEPSVDGDGSVDDVEASAADGVASARLWCWPVLPTCPAAIFASTSRLTAKCPWGSEHSSSRSCAALYVNT